MPMVCFRASEAELDAMDWVVRCNQGGSRGGVIRLAFRDWVKQIGALPDPIRKALSHDWTATHAAPRRPAPERPLWPKPGDNGELPEELAPPAAAPAKKDDDQADVKAPPPPIKQSSRPKAKRKTKPHYDSTLAQRRIEAKIAASQRKPAASRKGKKGGK
jgi:hypothetical protein